MRGLHNAGHTQIRSCPDRIRADPMNLRKTCGNPGTNVDRPLFVPGLPHTLEVSEQTLSALADCLLVPRHAGGQLPRSLILDACPPDSVPAEVVGKSWLSLICQRVTFLISIRVLHGFRESAKLHFFCGHSGCRMHPNQTSCLAFCSACRPVLSTERSARSAPATF